MNKNFNNVIVFPGVENKQCQEIELAVNKTQNKMNTIMTLNDYEYHPINDEDVMDLANFGDVMSFSSLAARRLISILASEIIKKNQTIYELESILDDQT